MFMISKLGFYLMQKKTFHYDFSWVNLREAFKLISTLYKTVNHNQEGFIKVWSIHGALPKCLRDEDGGEDTFWFLTAVINSVVIHLHVVDWTSAELYSPVQLHSRGNES